MISALIPCNGPRRHNDDWIIALRVLLSLPHDKRDQPYVNATYSALVWLRPEVAKRDAHKWTPISIPAKYLPEYEEDTVCAA